MPHQEFKVWLSAPHLNGTEIDYIQSAFKDNWISPYGENVDEFEKQLEEYFGVPDVALTNSGTSGIHLALILAGVEQDDEVLVPSLNFAGCVNPIRYQKAIPVFADSEFSTFNLDPEQAEEIIKDRIRKGKKPKAILAVDLFGIPCRLDSIERLAEEYEITLIEDAADAIGSRYNDRPLGTFGRMGIMSFNGNKVITTSGGGALISSDPDLTARAKYLSNQARSKTVHYQHDSIGYNYMLSNILAGIGRGQMPVLADRVARRRQIYARYQTELADIPSLYFPDDIPQAFSNRWLSVCLVRPEEGNPVDRDGLAQALRSRGIETRPVWMPMHLQPVFSAFPVYGCTQAEYLYRHGLCLPSGSGMTDSEQDLVIETIRKVMGIS